MGAAAQARAAAPLLRKEHPMKLIAALSVAGVFLMGASATAGTASPAEPDMVYATCSVCHGHDGISENMAFPDLAAQTKSYLVTQLENFQNHTRGDRLAKAYMWSAAGTLPKKTITKIADYYAAQTPPKGETGGDPAEIAAGKTIFEHGIESENVPACSACHGPAAKGTPIAPRLAGQHHLYLIAQLKAFRDNSRDNAIMHGNVEHMTDKQMRDIAAYLAAL
jgi:cytochrome c553